MSPAPSPAKDDQEDYSSAQEELVASDLLKAAAHGIRNGDDALALASEVASLAAVRLVWRDSELKRRAEQVKDLTVKLSEAKLQVNKQRVTIDRWKRGDIR